MDHLALQLHDRHGRMFVRVKFDEGEPAIGLHTDFREVADGLEQGNEVSLGAERDEVADVDSAIVRWGLLNNRLIREGSAREIHRCGCTACAGSRLDTSNRWCALRLLVGPVDTDCSGAKPFAVHRSNRLLSIRLIPESQKPVSTRLARVHVPHDPSVGKRTESAERLGEDLIVDFGAEISYEDVVVVASIFFVLLTLVCPVDTNLGVKNLATVESLERRLRRTHIHVLDETIVETTVLEVAIGDDFDMLNGTSHSEDLRKHILCHARAQVADVEMGPPLRCLKVGYR